MHEETWSNFSFSSCEEKMEGSRASIYEPFSMEEFKKRSASGKYKEINPVTNKVIEEGNFSFGQKTGKWIKYDQDGDEQHFQISKQRVGARCRDGSFSSATGRGACSWHGGVEEWLHQYVKVFVSGTGKYEPFQSRMKKIQGEAINLFGLQKIHNKDQLNYEIYKQAIKLKKEKNSDDSQNTQVLQEKLKSKDKIIEEMSEKLKDIKKDLEEKTLKLLGLKKSEERLIQQEQQINRLKQQNKNLQKMKFQRKKSQARKSPLFKRTKSQGKFSKFNQQSLKKIEILRQIPNLQKLEEKQIKKEKVKDISKPILKNENPEKRQKQKDSQNESKEIQNEEIKKKESQKDECLNSLSSVSVAESEEQQVSNINIDDIIEQLKKMKKVNKQKKR